MKPPWINLCESNSSQAIQANICIIGAGAAGLYLASELAKQSLDVVIIEAGPISALSTSKIGFDPIFELDDYPAATLGRYFGLGGSTTRWGGALIPHSFHDLRIGCNWEAVWSHVVDVIRSNASDVLLNLGYKNELDFDSYAASKIPDAAKELKRHGIDIQASLLMPFGRKNFLGLLSTLSPSLSPRIFYNAVVNKWVSRVGVSSDSSISRLHAVSLNGNEVVVSANKFIISAGAIESARILLEINESSGCRILPQNTSVGSFLADHLSMPIADVAESDRVKASTLFAPRFEGGWMRGFRFLEKAPSDYSPRSFAHFIFDNKNTGFHVAKDLLGALQGRRAPKTSLKELISGFGDMSSLAYHRFSDSQLFINRSCPVRLQLDIEQSSVKWNSVALSKDFDDYGRRIASICWSVSEDDLSIFYKQSSILLNLWSASSESLPKLVPIKFDGPLSKPYDAYHPVGTCRMGYDPDSVVDINLKVRSIANLWCVSTGVLPSAGTANPTFTLLCLTQAFASKLVHDCQ